MFRGFRPVICVLTLVCAVAASAGPDDVFDARIADVLQPGQRETILSIENGRYTLQDGHFLDARAIDPARRRLTNARVAKLLAANWTPISPLPAVSIPTSERHGQVLPLAAKSATTDPNFDGGGSRGGAVGGPIAGFIAGRPGSPFAPASLQAQLLQRLVFKGTKQEREALGEAVSSILKTKTGRELSAQFVAERASAEVMMGTIGDSTIDMKNGKKTLWGTNGQTRTDKYPPQITLNRAYLDIKPYDRRVAMTGNLAHELFGHALSAQRAKKNGIPRAALRYYRGDEICARLIDWLVQTELAENVVDDSLNKYLSDPEGYYRSLLTVNSYYTVILSPVEMKNPLATLIGRRKIVGADEAGTAADIKRQEEWRPVIAHFVSVHHIAKARFAPAEEELHASFMRAYRHLMKLVGIRQSLEGAIKLWSSPEGAKIKQQVIDAADSSYTSRMEAAAASWTRKLRRLRTDLRHRHNYASALGIDRPDLEITAPQTGEQPIDLAELDRMTTIDMKNNPRHWQ